MTAKKLAFCGMCIALAFVTSLIKLFAFPFGGEITLCSLLFIVLPAWFFGIPYGAVCGLIYGLLLFMMEPYYMTFWQFVFDYILAFSITGFAGIFRASNRGLIKGYILAVILRWVMATIAGMIWVSLGLTAWEGWSPLPYSMAYNAAYIFAEALITIILLLIPTVSHSLESVKKIAIE